MRYAFLFIFLLSANLSAQYYPTPTTWANKSPIETGLDPVAIDSAVAFAMANEY